jgi:hypothetical protein
MFFAITTSIYSQVNKTILQIADTSKYFGTNKAIGDFIDIKTYPFYTFKLNHTVTGNKSAGFALRSGWLDTIGKTRAVSSEWVKNDNNLSTASNYFVGIGKIPTTKLDVNGDVTVNGILYIGLKNITETKIDAYDKIVTRSNDSLELNTVAVLDEDSIYQKSGSYVTQYQFKTKPTQANPIKEIVQLGGDVKVTPIAVQLASATASLNLNDAQILWLLCDVIDSITVTSAVYNQAVAGTSVFDAYNGIGVYSISGTTATKMFETVSSLTLLTQAANTNVTISFPTPRLLVPGYYYIAVLGNWSTSNTLPALYSCNIGWLLSKIPLTNDLKIIGQTTGQSSLPANIATSSIIATNYCPLIILK